MRLAPWGVLGFRIIAPFLLLAAVPSHALAQATVCNETDDPGGIPDNTDDPDCTPMPAMAIPPGAMLGSGGTGNPSGYTSEPVNTATGNYLSIVSDLAFQGRGLPFVFTRFYNSQDPYSGPLGAGWTHSYNVLLTVNSDHSVTIKWGDGHQEFYTPTSTTTFKSSLPGVFNSLVKNGDGTYTLTTKRQIRYAFSSIGLLMSLSDRNANALTFSYSGGGNLTTITDTVGRVVTLAYDSANHLLSITDPIGRVVRYTYDGSSNLLSRSDPLGNSITYAYDANHRMTRITDENGAVVVTNVYDSSGRVATQTNGRGLTTTFSYNTTTGRTTFTDPRNGITTHVYDGQHRLIQVIDALGGVLNYTYDVNNNRAGITNQNGNNTAFGHDSLGNVSAYLDPLQNIFVFTYDSKNNLTSLTLPSGQVTQFTYDTKGNLLTTKDALGNTTTLSYDTFGQVLTGMDPRGNTTTFAYDASGNLIKTTDALGFSTTRSYDAVGRLLAVTNQAGKKWTQTYDAENRLLSSVDPLGNSTTFHYDAVGQLVLSVNALNGQTQYQYDATRNLTRVVDALSHSTLYAYDGNNNLTSLTDANGHTTSYSYDAANRPSARQDPLGNRFQLVRDLVGNVTQTTDGNGVTNRFSYDVDNRLTLIAYGDGASVTYTYTADGQRATMTDSTGATKYSYDGRNRLVTVATPTGTIKYQYDGAGNRTQLTYPDGRIVSRAFDALNRLNTVKDFNNQITTYGYDAVGRPVSAAFPNSTSATYQYDDSNRLVALTNLRGMQVISTFSYTLDALGRKAQVVANGVKSTHTYDALSRLLSVVSPQLGENDYVYDAVGNITSTITQGTATPMTYDAADQLLSAGTWSFAYDRNGNQTSSNKSGFVTNHNFNAAGYITKVTRGTASAVYQYDGDGNKVGITQGAVGTQLINDAAGAIRLAQISSGATTDYVYGLNRISEVTPTAEYFYETDGLGSVVNLTTSVGSIAATYSYDPWGRPEQGALGISPTPFRYTGEELDSFSGLYYLRNRWYDPSTNRFLSRDKFSGVTSSPSTLHRYAYVGNNPVNYIDSFGLSAQDSSSGPWQWIQNNPGLAIAGAVGIVAIGACAVIEPCGAVVAGALGFGSEAGGAIALEGGAEASLLEGGASVANPIPATLARVIPNGIDATSLGAPGATDVFVTNAAELEGLNAQQIAAKLGIPENPTGFQVIEFPTPNSGLASPVFRTNPGFIGGGQTIGGASEFVIPNGPIPPGSTITVVP